MVWEAIVCAYIEIVRVLCFLEFFESLQRDTKNQNQNFSQRFQRIQRIKNQFKSKTIKPPNKNQTQILHSIVGLPHKKRAGVWGILRGIRGVPRNKPPCPPYREKSKVGFGD
ncbi:hypothetical protein BBW65_00410 [Helicobacter enhydrae]|uniref:Uncharacterized protein n=1 Tax=Helicobacter enhydrae TaxID=222136 RepID=A0A1B1U3V4_9HELI|nr:hypothetical protein BBW65_00410 [Helicobacter enhydrae]